LGEGDSAWQLVIFLQRQKKIIREKSQLINDDNTAQSPQYMLLVKTG
jgi:hypothetical protein